VTPVRILIADDHEVVRQGVRIVLETQPGWAICGEAGTGRDAVAMAVELQPDVVVLDISMPELNGLEATRQIRRVASARILILTVHESDQVASEVRDAGAHGYVLKSEAGRILVAAIRTLLEHRESFTERVHASAAPPHQSRPHVKGASRRLTPRQREVLQLLSEGRSNKEIAAALGITSKTAETHRSNIMGRLELHSLSELVRYAIRNQITQP
jgi:DNA-binding NarL/FixJ family response regulator